MKSLLAVGAGFSIIGMIAAFGFAGYALDKRLGTWPLGLTAGLLIGAVSSIVWLIRLGREND